MITEHLRQKINLLQSHIEQEDNFEDVFKGAAETYAALFGSDSHFIKILLRELANPDGKVVYLIGDLIKKSQVPHNLINMMDSAKASGKLRDINIKQALMSFITMNIGFFLMYPILKQTFDIDDFNDTVEKRKSAVVDLFLNGVLNK